MLHTLALAPLLYKTHGMRADAGPLPYLVVICCWPSNVRVHDGDCDMDDGKGNDPQIIPQHQGGPPVEIIDEVGA